MRYGQKGRKGRVFRYVRDDDFNSQVGSTGVFVASSIVVLLGTTARMVVGSWSKGFKIVDLTSKGREQLFGSASPTVGAGTRVVFVVDVVFFLELMATWGREIEESWGIIDNVVKEECRCAMWRWEQHGEG